MHDEGEKDTEDSKIKRIKETKGSCNVKTTKDLTFHLPTEHPACHQRLSRVGHTDIATHRHFIANIGQTSHPSTRAQHTFPRRNFRGLAPSQRKKIEVLGTMNPRRTAMIKQMKINEKGHPQHAWINAIVTLLSVG